MEVIGGDNYNQYHLSDWLQPFPAIADGFTTEEPFLQPFSPGSEDEFDYLEFLRQYIEVPEVSKENDRSSFADSLGIANEEVSSQSLSPSNEDESDNYAEFLQKYLEVSEETSMENDQDRSTSINLDSDQDRLPDGRLITNDEVMLQAFPASTSEDESNYLEFLRKHLEVSEEIVSMENDQLDLEQRRVNGSSEKEEEEKEHVARAEEYFRMLPPGCIFLPTDEELITNYLTRKVNNQPLPVNRIRTVALYDYHPDVLIETHCGKNGQREKQWYFFTLREGKSRKRPRRSAAGGYWKASGIDMAVTTSNGEVIGHRKALDFYNGKQPGGTRSHWKMHEFRLEQRSPSPNTTIAAAADSNKLNDLVLCKLYMKGESRKKDDYEEGGSKRRKVEQQAAEVEAVATIDRRVVAQATRAADHENVLINGPIINPQMGSGGMGNNDDSMPAAAFELEYLDSWMFD